MQVDHNPQAWASQMGQNFTVNSKTPGVDIAGIHVWYCSLLTQVYILDAEDVHIGGHLARFWCLNTLHSQTEESIALCK